MQKKAALKYSARLMKAVLEGLESRVLFSESALSIITHGQQLPLPQVGASHTAAASKGLAGEYFTGNDFQTPVAVSTTPEIYFNWNYGRPLASVPAGDFSVKWTGTITPVKSGTYTFYTSADSGTNVIIDGTSVIDNFSSRTPSLTSGAIALTAGVPVSIEVDYVSRGEHVPAKMALLWSSSTFSKRLVPASVLTPANVSLPAEPLTATYYIGKNFNEQVFTEAESAVHFNLAPTVPDALIPDGDSFSVNWTGDITAPETGNYVFETITDDGVRLFVNGTLEINQFHDESSTSHYATVPLTAGQSYSITMEYYDNGIGQGIAKLLWHVPVTNTTAYVPFTLGAQAMPLAPTNVSATPFSSSQVDLSWSDVTGETGFIIDRSSDGGATFTPVGTTGQGVTTFDDTGLTPGTAYEYQVVAVNSAGDSPASTTAFATTPLAVPAAPADVSAAPVSSSQVNLNWADVAGETSFIIERSGDGGATFAQVGTTAQGVTSFDDTGLTASTAYEYEIVAVSSAGDSAASTAVSATTLAGVPAMVVATATLSAATTATITWTAAPTATGYVVQESANGTSGWTQAATTTTLSATLTGLTNATTYYYRVFGTDASGSAAPSNVVSVTTVPVAPTNLAATVASASEIDLSWNNVTGQTGFIVQESANGTSGWAQIASVVSATTTFHVGGLSAATTYYFRVQATDAGGSSGPSNIVHATTSAANPNYAALTTLYGLNGSGNVYSVDASTGATTQIGTLAFGTYAAGRDPLSGNLFYVSLGTSTVQIADWNPNDGVNTVINTSVSVGAGIAMAAFRDDGQFFITDDNGDLYAISSSTGDATLKGVIHANGSVLDTGYGDMAFGPDGTLYIDNSGILYSVASSVIDAGTGSGSAINVTELGASGSGNLQIAFGQNGVLYGVTNSTGQLNSINLSNGAITPIGSPSGVLLNDLASIPLYGNLSVAQTASSFVRNTAGSYTITASNAGPDTTVGPITLVDTLAAGVSFASGSGTGWTFSVSGSTVTMTYIPNVAAGASAPTVTLNVNIGSIAANSVTNTVLASTTEFETNTANNTNSISTAVTG